MIKVLVVDDEKWVRRGIIEKADWAQLNAVVVAEACNGSEGLKLAREYHPEIIITDMRMPELDGSEFMAELQKELPQTKVIVISGYSDYEYTRQALLNKAVDYLLKPIEKEALNQVLAKAIQEYQTSLLEQDRSSENLPLLRNKLLNTIIAEVPHDFSNILNELEKAGVCINSDYYEAAVVLIADFRRIGAEKYAGNSNLLDSMIAEQIQEYLGENMVCFKKSDQENQFVIIHGSRSQVWREYELNEYDRKFTGLACALENSAGFQIRIGIGGRYQGVENIQQSLKEALQAIYSMNIFSEDKVRFFNQIGPREKPVHPVNPEDMDVLFKFILGGDLQEVEKQLDSIFYKLKSAGYLTINGFQSMGLEFLVRLEEELRTLKIDFSTVFGENITGQTEKILKYYTFDEFEARFRQLTLKLTGYIKIHLKAGSKEIVELIRDYIQEHYGEKIKLSAISEKFFLSESYLCKVFKKETGQNFVDYLTAIRMEKARHLLKNHQLKIQEVASLVGYEDARHFSKLFKRYYRDNPSNIKQNFSG